MADGETEITGSLPINTDGGLIANGEPIGASGLRQIHELVRQLRGGGRRPSGTRVTAGGLRPTYGAPGTAAATILTRWVFFTGARLRLAQPEDAYWAIMLRNTSSVPP